MHHPAMDVGQPELPALKPVGQFFVINPEEMQERGLQVMDVNTIVGHVHRQFVGFTIA